MAHLSEASKVDGVFGLLVLKAVNPIFYRYRGAEVRELPRSLVFHSPLMQFSARGIRNEAKLMIFASPRPCHADTKRSVASQGTQNVGQFLWSCRNKELQRLTAALYSFALSLFLLRSLGSTSKYRPQTDCAYDRPRSASAIPNYNFSIAEV